MKATGLPLSEGLTHSADMPHTISHAILYRARIDSFNELPKKKRPPRNLWDKPQRLNEFLDKVWDLDSNKGTDNVDVNWEEVE